MSAMILAKCFTENLYLSYCVNNYLLFHFTINKHLTDTIVLPLAF